MMATLGRFPDGDIPIGPERAAALRLFFAQWQAEL